MLDVSQIAPGSLRPISRAEYDRLIELGFFDEDEKVELLYGCLVQTTPQGTAHAFATQVLTRLLLTQLGDRAEVRIQLPLAASDDSEPEPDIAVVPPADYRKEHPRNAWLIVEVANTSQRKDRNIKARLYAETQVDEYWLVDVAARTVEVYTQPRDGAYANVVTRRPGESLSLVRFPDVSFPVDALF